MNFLSEQNFGDLCNGSTADSDSVCGSSNLSSPAKISVWFRCMHEKTRKTEISRDFSAFFMPYFFRISIDPVSIFFRVEGFELPKMRFFKNWIRNASDRKDLNPRQGFKFFRFFVLDINCLQTVPSKTEPSLLREDPNPRNAKKRFFWNRSIEPTKGFKPANPKYCPLKTKKKPRRTVAYSFK